MKKLLFALAITCCSYIAVNAQTQDNGQKMQEEMRKVLKDSLQLTDAQLDSVSVVQQTYGPKLREIFMDQSTSMDQKMQKMEPIRIEMKARMKNFLTSEQMAKMDAMEQNMRQRVQSGGGSH